MDIPYKCDLQSLLKVITELQSNHNINDIDTCNDIQKMISDSFFNKTSFNSITLLDGDRSVILDNISNIDMSSEKHPRTISLAASNVTKTLTFNIVYDSITISNVTTNHVRAFELKLS